MEMIGLPRRGGKTHQIVERMKAHAGSVLVVMDHAEAQRLRHVYELEPEQVVVASEAHSLRSRSSPPTFYVDNADAILRNLLGGRVAAATWTPGE